jgi:hypothetical protein
MSDIKQAMTAVEQTEAKDEAAQMKPLSAPRIKSKDIIDEENAEKERLSVTAINGILEAFNQITRGPKITTAILGLINHAQAEIESHFDAAMKINEANGGSK